MILLVVEKRAFPGPSTFQHDGMYRECFIFWACLQRAIVSIKMVGNTTIQFTPPSPPPKREPQVGRGFFGVHLLILYFKSSTFHLFLNFTYPSRKNISFPKCPKSPKNLQQTAGVQKIARVYKPNFTGSVTLQPGTT